MNNSARFRHALIWRLVRLPACVFLKLRFRFSARPAPDMTEPFLLIANHLTDFDPLFVGARFKKNIYFVASEHLYRRGFLSHLLSWAFAPIARIKGSADTVSAMNIIRTLRRGSSVCIFAEGDRSWNGVTGPLHATTARLVKAARVPLVTYRLTGGYLTSPRWSRSLRRGKIDGGVVRVTAAQALAAMTDEDLTAMIFSDIYDDAYDDQEKTPVVYRGKKLAEGLENAIYTCPVCRGIGTTHSSGDLFYCDCGLTLRYTEMGYLEGERAPFKTIRDWDAWQTVFLRDAARSFGDGPIFEDTAQSLWRIGDDHSETLVAEGSLTLSKKSLALGSFVVPLENIYRMGVYGAATIVFSADGVNYEIKSEVSRSGRKYLTMYDILTACKKP
ncbi:1-acyl-sn-glycerol-3-phosphate acyltransferase [Oscillospiraceae bacterium CM]|nr:1-acyl-sn-glycerol-3-phosphate acyltransferase [Oscillospiraceae bacterium CM]